MTHTRTKTFARILAILVAIAIASSAVAQNRRAKISSWQKQFLIDPAKPYVYLEVDHIGPRQPRAAGEPKIGIWMRLHNNCIVPIIVYTFGVPDFAFAPPSPGRNEEIGVYDSVIANPRPWGFIRDQPPHPATLTETMKPSDLANYLWAKPQLQAAPTATAPPPPSPKPKGAKMPMGYWFDVGTDTIIHPGESIYFSLPRNHVSPKWHVQIPFHFDLDVHSPIPRPENYVTLYEDQVEEKIHSQKTN